jgi:hypothetical protein
MSDHSNSIVPSLYQSQAVIAENVTRPAILSNQVRQANYSLLPNKVDLYSF